MGEKTFNLTWNNHLANLSGLFEALYKSGSLTDATLACQGGMLRAHRLVLAACSPYFERVFKEHYGEQPILILKGVAIEEMECLLDFMYKGSIDVAEEHLPSLIKTATDLEIRGLSGESKNQEGNCNLYTRVETRMQRCHIETRVHTTEYIKEPSVIPFLPKHSTVDAMEDHIKVEDIEVEDDPMVIDGHEDSFDEFPQSTETQIKRIPPPMYKRETRFKGQKRVSVGRVTRNNDPPESRSKDSSRESSCEDVSRIVKCEPNLNDGSADVSVSDVQRSTNVGTDILSRRARSIAAYHRFYIVSEVHLGDFAHNVGQWIILNYAIVYDETIGLRYYGHVLLMFKV
ncbi:PREDICTED: kelch-like protein 12 [Trachymyrmex septentrionalis]|uniref:kelch-like protein 12 n=1 Tax=Trachymyrmex septentrionalis TaxID=34720 RepID=UPI00084ED774|nr:PREDICTED: kelch-like protein 12 [Trachymyrmex septentrionalis]